MGFRHIDRRGWLKENYTRALSGYLRGVADLDAIKRIIRLIFHRVGYELHRIPQPIRLGIPDEDLYRPLFSPWLGQGEFSQYYNIAGKKTLVSIDRCYVIYLLLLQAIHVDGEVWECGVYRGGTAAMIAAILRDKKSPKKLVLFDTFDGMPDTDKNRDLHEKGDFSDTSVTEVSNYVGIGDKIIIRKGFIPETFSGLETMNIAFAHIDVDIYKSIIDCLDFIWPRLSLGGVLIFDDYGFPSCPGARAAVDEFFHNQRCFPLCLSTGQALVFKAVA